MDLDKIIARVKAILVAPRTEWPVIAAEPGTVGGIYTGYVMILAAIPAVFGFLKHSVIGIDVPFLGTYRAGIGAGLSGMVVGYALALASVYVLSLIVNALAPTFGGQKNPLQAFKAVVYASTASWIAGIGHAVPWLSMLILLAGGIYGIYLLYLGLPQTMKCPAEKAAGYTAVTILIAVVLGWLISLTVAAIVGVGSPTRSAGAPEIGDSSAGGFAKDSPMGKLESMARQAEEASKKMEAAQKSGDAKAQAEAMGELMGAVLGGGQVVALAPERIKLFLPEALAGLKRTSLTAERNSAMGIQMSEARATYSDGAGRSLELEIVDMGGMKGAMAFAGWAGVEQEKESEQGYEKSYKRAGRLVHEQWDRQRQVGEYAEVVGERFSVKVRGEAMGIDSLKSAVKSVDLAGLEALRNEGAKKN